MNFIIFSLIAGPIFILIAKCNSALSDQFAQAERKQKPGGRRGRSGALVNTGSR